MHSIKMNKNDLMKKMLIVTTVNDLSIPFFLTQDVLKKVVIDFAFFHEDISHIKKKLSSIAYDFIYIRDPFNASFEKADIEEKCTYILMNKNEGRIIDSLTSMDDIYFEDKWNQYQVFSECMPKTKLLENIEQIDQPGYITKKRISSRSRGIVFNARDFKGGDVSEYVIQEMIPIDVEYRVNVIFNEIVEDVTIKNSKTNNSGARIVHSEKISKEVRHFVRGVLKDTTFDFIGLDIAVSGNNIYLIELNRSCLFGGHFRITGDNLAVFFIDALLKRSR